MPSLFLYLLKFSISLGCLFVFYFLVLRPLTFYQWNRVYLAGYALLSFIVPFIDITPLVKTQSLFKNELLNTIPTVERFTAVDAAAGVINSPGFVIDPWMLLLFLFISGSLIMLLRLCWQVLSLHRIKSEAALIHLEEISFYDVRKPINPFSFGNDIFVNRSRHSEEELEKIIRHEFVHVKQKHTVDLMIGELLCIFNWYNPFAWLIRKAIRENLEFIADNKVLQSGVDAKQYQYLLLKVLGLPQYSITNHFSFSSLKKRIAMMNKLRSAKLHMIRFLFVLPLAAVMLLAFRNNHRESSSPGKPVIRYIGIAFDMADGKPLTGITVTEQQTAQKAVSDANGYFSFIFPVKNKLTLLTMQFEKPGYNKVITGLMNEYQKEPFGSQSLVEITGMKRGASSDECRGCLTSTSMKYLQHEAAGYEQAREELQGFLTSSGYLQSSFKQEVVRELEQEGLRIQAEAVRYVIKGGQTVTFSDGKMKVDTLFPPIPPVAPVKPVPPVKELEGTIPPVPPAPVITPMSPLPGFEKLPASIKSMEINNNKVAISFKNGKKEYYDLDKPDEKAAFHKKYSVSPKAPVEKPLPPVPSKPEAPAKQAAPPVKEEVKTKLWPAGALWMPVKDNC